MGKLHDLNITVAIFLEEKWHMRHEYLSELVNWGLAALVLAALAFTLGFSIAYWKYS